MAEKPLHRVIIGAIHTFDAAGNLIRHGQHDVVSLTESEARRLVGLKAVVAYTLPEGVRGAPPAEGTVVTNAKPDPKVKGTAAAPDGPSPESSAEA